jgi:hypothetical protein
MNRLAIVPLAAFLSLLGAHQAVAGLELISFEIPDPDGSTHVAASKAPDTYVGVPMDLPKQLDPELIAIRDAGEALPVGVIEHAEARLDATRRRVDEEAATNGDEKIVARMAEEFGMTEEALHGERDHLTVGWGNLLVAHTIVANARIRLTVAQLFDLYHEGVQWAQIAGGLKLDLNEFAWAVGVETRVALGFGRPDGQIAAVPAEPLEPGLSAEAGSR